VRARSVGIATGAYTAPNLHPSLTSRVMPILSNSMVTRPLTQQEIAACNFRTTQVLTDTRTLRFYYRFLPDNRLQIGSRSAITGADAPNPRHYELLIEGMGRKFPALRGIQIDYSWWGWVDVSHDMMPRVCQPDPKQSVFYALGYGGNGVSYSQQAGRRLAERIAGKGAKQTLPIFTSPSVRTVSPHRPTHALPVVLPARRETLNALCVPRRLRHVICPPPRLTRTAVLRGQTGPRVKP
jgi:glycine/D-amino acid oxidase-like deaminating enzyme